MTKIKILKWTKAFKWTMALVAFFAGLFAFLAGAGLIPTSICPTSICGNSKAGIFKGANYFVGRCFSGSPTCTLSVRQLLTTKSSLSFDAPDSAGIVAGQFCCTDQPPMVKDLFGINGISEVSIRPYEVKIRKGDAFTWDEIVPQVNAVLAKHAPEP